MAETPDPPDGKRFRKLPIEVEAIRWDGSMESQAQIITWSRGVIEGMFGSLFHEENRYYLLVPTLHGLTAAEVGDWVVRGPSGDYWPVKPEIFTESYESIPIVDDATRQEVEELVADKKRHVRDDPLGLAEANERLVSADTGDFEACDVCDAIEDICVIHAAEGVGSAQMTQLLRFVLDEPEGAWGWMQETERRRATCRESEAAYFGRND